MGVKMQELKPISKRYFAYRQTRQDVLEQLRDLGHQLMIIETGAIPLQQRKFRIVRTPFLTVSKHFTERVNQSTASDQQTLHGEFQPALQVNRGVPATGTARINIRIRDRRPAH